jgi:hypothetical protein
MDTEKLFKAIQIVVKEEVKKQLSLIKEEIRKEIISEIKKTTPKKSLKSMVSGDEDAFQLAERILAQDRDGKQYSKNPMINQLLNETAIRPGFSRTDGDWGTITPEMVGYGDVRAGYQSQTAQSLPSTGNDLIDKAIARSAAVLKASKEKKG